MEQEQGVEKTAGKKKVYSENKSLMKLGQTGCMEVLKELNLIYILNKKMKRRN